MVAATLGLAPQRAPGVQRTAARRRFVRKDAAFAFYYPVRDAAFRRAAETWRAELPASHAITSANVHLYAVQTLPDFRVKWNSLTAIAAALGFRYRAAALFLHGSDVTDARADANGLEFAPSGSRAGPSTGYRNLVRQLAQLPWVSGAVMSIKACWSGHGDAPVARLFAEAQGIDVTGEDGFAYFSASNSRYVEIRDSNQRIYLNAYNQGRNTLIRGMNLEFQEAGNLIAPKRYRGSKLFRRDVPDSQAGSLDA